MEKHREIGSKEWRKKLKEAFEFLENNPMIPYGKADVATRDQRRWDRKDREKIIKEWRRSCPDEVMAKKNQLLVKKIKKRIRQLEEEIIRNKLKLEGMAN